MEAFQDSRSYLWMVGLLYLLTCLIVYLLMLPKGQGAAIAATVLCAAALPLICLGVTFAWTIVLVPLIHLVIRWNSR